MECPVFYTSRLIGTKYSIPLLLDVRAKKFKGFNDWSKKTGITAKLLSQRLQEMQGSGLLKKTASGNYFLTEKGLDLCKLVDATKEFNVKWSNLPATCLTTSCADCPTFTEIQAGSKRKKGGRYPSFNQPFFAQPL